MVGFGWAWLVIVGYGLMVEHGWLWLVMVGDGCTRIITRKSV